MARILVVEDEGIVARDIQHVVESLGHAVVALVSSGRDAVQQAAELRPDLVLMDIVLRGDMNGIDAAERIRAEFEIPIVYLTAYADEPTLRRAKHTEPFGYILKPYHERELHTAIEIALYRHRLERRLKESEKWLTTTLQSIADAVIVTDAKGAVVLINRAGEAITRWSQAEALGQDASRLFRIERAGGGALEHPVMRALREGATFVLEDHIKLIARDGSAISIGDSVAPIKDASGKVEGSVLVFRDVSDRERAEQALRESEARLRESERRLAEAQRIAHVGYWDRDYETDRLTLSDEAYRIFGLPGETSWSITSWHERWLQLVHPGDRERVAGAVAHALSGGPPYDVEYRIVRADGEVRFVHSQGVVTWGASGLPRRMFGTMQDITERTRAEEARREAEKKYREIFENAVEGIFQTTPEGRFLTANPAAARQLGYGSPEELIAAVTDIGRQLYVDPERRREFTQKLEKFGRVQGFVEQIRRRDGSTIWISETAHAIRDASGAIAYYEGTAVDITERHRAEEAEAELRNVLERAALEWELTFDAIEAPIVILDGAFRIARLNRAAKELSGSASYQQILGRAISDVAGGQPWQKIAEAAAQVTVSNAPVQAEVRDDATGKTWDVSAAPSAGLAGQGPRVIVVARDVTRLTELQESLQRSETMSTLGSLVAGVAHEVRNPLFSISANLDAFEAQFGDRAEYTETIAVLRAEVSRLVGVMNELLDYGRPAVNSPEPTSLHLVVEESLRVCAGLAQQRGVELRNRVPQGLDAVFADRERVARVFQNLIENAVQHSPAGGLVSVAAETVDALGVRAVDCAVEDAGPGFREEDLPHVFEPFFTRRRGGTGLGLSIVQRIVELHGGSIRVANRAEGGARVTVRLPCAPAYGMPRGGA